MGMTRKTVIPKSNQGCVLRATEANRKLWGERGSGEDTQEVILNPST